MFKLQYHGECYTTMSDMWSFGAVISFIANKGNHLFKSVPNVLVWPGGKSSLDSSVYSIELRQLTADLLNPDMNFRHSADKVNFEANKANRQADPRSLMTLHRQFGTFNILAHPPPHLAPNHMVPPNNFAPNRFLHLLRLSAEVLRPNF